MWHKRDEIPEMLEVDPLSLAEKMTGKSYKEDSGTLQLGMLLHLKHVQQTAAVLKACGDSQFAEPLESYLSIIKAEGFEEVLCMPIQDPEFSHTNQFHIFWHPDGILLVFDTYFGNGVSGGKFYYNWRPKEGLEQWYRYVSSGGMKEGRVWVGDHDCREAIRHHIADLRANGVFLKKWVERPFLWLLHYMDTKVEGYDYAAINEERIARLPKHVRDAISPEKI